MSREIENCVTFLLSRADTSYNQPRNWPPMFLYCVPLKMRTYSCDDKYLVLTAPKSLTAMLNKTLS